MAKYSVDGRFYRAEIISVINIDTDTDTDTDTGDARAGVRFTDYGSFEYVPRSR